jgi:hypothetical protein
VQPLTLREKFMSSSRSKMIVGCLTVVMVSAASYFLWLKQDVSGPAAAREGGLSTGTLHAGNSSSRMGASSGSGPRAHANAHQNSPAHVAVKQVTLSKAELETHPRYWMLGYSEQDVGWLARFDYPALEEEARLSQATDDQLFKLSEAGNLNARVHLGIRYAPRALMSNDSRAIQQARSMIEQALIEGGPYHAAKTADFFVNLATNRRDLGNLNDDQRTALQNQFLPLYEMAKGISAMYGDFATARVVNRYRDIGPMFGLPESQPMPFEFALARLANMNKERVRRQLMPYEVVQRPSPPGPTEILSIQTTNTVFVR